MLSRAEMERDRRPVITTVRPCTVFLFATSRAWWSRGSIPVSGRFHAINDRSTRGIPEEDGRLDGAGMEPRGKSVIEHEARRP